MKHIAKYSKVFLLLVVAYFGFVVVSCLLPDHSIKRHIAESAQKIAAEGLYPKAIINKEQCQMDNFTDALIMNQIYSIDRKRPLTSAMRMIRMSEKGLDWDQTGLLLRTVNGEPLEEQHYARYWHGSSFLYRFLFLTVDYDTLRMLLFIVSTLILIGLCCQIYLRAGWATAFALVMGFVFTYGFVAQFSLQFFPILCLTAVTIFLVVKKRESTDYGILFFIVGSLACYFDLLTVPLLTLGIPLAVMVALKRDDEFRINDNLREIIKLSLLWGLGFALTFATKWGMASLVLGQNILADGMDAGFYRMEADEFTRWDAVIRNFGMLPLGMIGIAAAATILFGILRHSGFNYLRIIPLFVIALMPYAWYLLLANHSYEHWWFTYRLQAVSVICLFFMLLNPEPRSKS